MSKNDNAGKMKGLFAGINAAKQGDSNGAVSETKQDQVPPPKAETTKSEGRSRPKGKRSSPDHTQVSAYIPNQTHLDIKMALLKEALRKGDRKPREFSDLVNDLLRDWLAQQPSD